jgi:hypothetical protein
MFSAWRAARIDGLRGPALARSARRPNDIESSAPLQIAANCMPKVRAKLRGARSTLGARDGETIDSHRRLHGPMAACATRRRRCFVFAMCRLLCARRDKMPRAPPGRGRFGTYRSDGARSRACARLARVNRQRTSRLRHGRETPALRRPPTSARAGLPGCEHRIASRTAQSCDRV